MNTLATDVIKELDQKDREKVVYFARLLLSQAKYRKLCEEISQRRKEVETGDILEHEDFWKNIECLSSSMPEAS